MLLLLSFEFLTSRNNQFGQKSHKKKRVLSCVHLSPRASFWTLSHTNKSVHFIWTPSLLWQPINHRLRHVSNFNIFFSNLNSIRLDIEPAFVLDIYFLVSKTSEPSEWRRNLNKVSNIGTMAQTYAYLEL